MIKCGQKQPRQHHDRDSHLANGRNVVVDILDLDQRSDPRFGKTYVPPIKLRIRGSLPGFTEPGEDARLLSASITAQAGSSFTASATFSYSPGEIRFNWSRTRCRNSQASVRTSSTSSGLFCCPVERSAGDRSSRLDRSETSGPPSRSRERSRFPRSGASSRMSGAGRFVETRRPIEGRFNRVAARGGSPRSVE